MVTPHLNSIKKSQIAVLAEQIQEGLQRIQGESTATDNVREQLLTEAFQKIVDAQPEAMLRAAQNQSRFQLPIKSTKGGHDSQYSETDLNTVEPYQALKSAFAMAGHPITSVSFSPITKMVKEGSSGTFYGDINVGKCRVVGVNIDLSFRP